MDPRLRCVAVDLETTGLVPGHDRIVEIGSVASGPAAPGGPMIDLAARAPAVVAFCRPRGAERTFLVEAIREIGTV